MSTREGLFRCAIRFPGAAESDTDGSVSAVRADALAEQLTRSLGVKLSGLPPASLALLRSMLTHPEAAASVRASLEVEIGRLSSAAPGPDAGLRSALAAAMLLGVTIGREMLAVPALTDASVADIQRVMRPVLHVLMDDERPRPVRYQVVIDCADPDRQAHFWAAALGYELAPPPAGFVTWNDFYRAVGLSEDDLPSGTDRISDPHGAGPTIWFHALPEPKTVKNRLHFDIHASGDRTDTLEARRRRVDAEAERLVALGATQTVVMFQEGVDHYAVGMKDPEGNEFDIN